MACMMSRCPLIFHVILGQLILFVVDFGQNMSIIFVRSDLMDWTKLKCQADQSCLKIVRKPKDMLLTHPSRSKHAVWLSWSFHLRWKHSLRFMCYIRLYNGRHLMHFFSLLGRMFWDKKPPKQLRESFDIHPCSPHHFSPMTDPWCWYINANIKGVY